MDSLLSRNLVRMRRGRGWTQEQLAAASGVNRITIASIEAAATRGPRATTLERLAEALGAPTAAFYWPDP